ncbi:dihydropteroate synthase [Xinfangfangia sp. CPCC 101601]|uniref:Dihydropteroate synthase n=1 Tax=Pseudogemmobacter lacusdianii TaxID=3069608 RepID=A0ABU0VVT0_9RHOB|nr:dihydropteroate synthase [Xinfangfangia sp. CPCC 101601]MDQ2065852.1 dihydropteroate synthase [Xinfangfangia sp. CPCC 101601]
MIYWRPLVQSGAVRPKSAVPLAGSSLWFSEVERLERGRASEVVPAAEAGAALEALSAARADFAGLSMRSPQIMGILNVTPDSFSDGGRFLASDDALAQARAIARDADILDIGGESTRPGSAAVAVEEEIARTAPVIAALRADGVETVISVDTRKGPVAAAALQAGAQIVNDVAALSYDAEIGPLVAARQAPVILMHHQGSPETMQLEPRYDDVLLDVYDWLAERLAAALALGIPKERIALDPGIGFGKTVEHNLTLLRGLSLFHALGCPVLLGASRKRFIGTIAQVGEARDRMPGSVAVALAGVAQGMQMIRVHDVAETRQALRLWQAVNGESV